MKKYFINLTEKDRIRVEITVSKGKILNFVVQLETFLINNWEPAVRYNYAHGFPHKDLIFRNGKKIKENISEESLSKIVNWAINELKINWKKYLRRCGFEKL
ncbi:MAG: hypothetical protein AB1765_08315 [Candidatus Hydrogenedentota bacterium]